jgi:hypothetical protein
LIVILAVFMTILGNRHSSDRPQSGSVAQSVGTHRYRTLLSDIRSLHTTRVINSAEINAKLKIPLQLLLRIDLQ